MSRFQEAARKKGRPLVTMAVLRYNPVFVEMAARAGVDVLWIEMEHMDVRFTEASDLCALGSALGMLTLIRVPNAERQNVLRAAECGPDILDVPIVDTPEVAQELVKHARFAPQGDRGHFGGSRATHYGLFDSIVGERERLNREICLMAQIETIQAVERADDIAQVAGLDAIFIGRGDLSASLGVPGQLTHPTVEEATQRAIAAARRHGKLVGVPGSMTDYRLWAEQGVELYLCGGDVAAMKLGLQTMMAQIEGQA